MEVFKVLVLEELAPTMPALLPPTFIALNVTGKTHVGRHGVPWAAGGRTSPVPGSQEVELPFCMNVCGCAGGGDVDVGAGGDIQAMSAILRKS